MKHQTRTLTVIAICAASLLLCANAKAALTPIGPFTGNLSETWESFANYSTGPFYLADPTPIMAGGAVISSPLMAVYEPGVSDFGLAGNGTATVSDGVKGMGLDNYAQTATISFLNPIYDFGAYWGNAFSTVELSFSDGSTESFSYSRPGDGVLEWHGWNSTVGISSVSYTGDYVVIDGLQANTVVPEPSTYIAGAMLLIPVGLQGLRTLRNRRKSA